MVSHNQVKSVDAAAKKFVLPIGVSLIRRIFECFAYELGNTIRDMMWQTTFGQRTLFLGRGVFRAPKRGIVTGVGRLGFNVLRVPLAAAGFGTGATAYIVYRVKGVTFVDTRPMF